MVKPPPRQRFFPAEWDLIQEIRTPEAAQDFLYDIPYNNEPNGDTLYSFRLVVRHNTAHCLEGALAAAAILEHHGYPPLLLDLESADGIDHVLFIFKEKGRYGTVAVSNDDGLYGRRPVFKTVEALVDSYYGPYITEKARITGYAIVDLRKVTYCDWRFSENNLDALEDYLNDYPHYPFRVPKIRYLMQLAKYRIYKPDDPSGDLPLHYFHNRHEWWAPDG